MTNLKLPSGATEKQWGQSSNPVDRAQQSKNGATLEIMSSNPNQTTANVPIVMVTKKGSDVWNHAVGICELANVEERREHFLPMVVRSSGAEEAAGNWQVIIVGRPEEPSRSKEHQKVCV